jgi:hypothetical protein
MTYRKHIRGFGLGLSLPCLLMLSACSPKAVRTETVTVKVPSYVALPTDLLRPCAVEMPAVWTNGTLLDYALQIKACLNASNDKLNRIRGLQP